MTSRGKILCLFGLLAFLTVLGAGTAVRGSEAESKNGEAFLLISEGERVAVKTPDGETVPTDIPTPSLREEDRRLLAEGIPAGSREELMMLLEDLGS